MQPRETIATGAPTVCPTCQVSVLPLVVLWSAAGAYIGTRCQCAPSYTRESDYYPSEADAEAALTSRSFGRGGIVARDVPAYWPGQPAERDTVDAERRFARLMRRQRERKARLVAQIIGTPPADVSGDGGVTVPSGRSRRFRVAVLHNTGPGRFHRYLSSDPLTRVFDLTVEAPSAEVAAKVVFAIANSYLDELYCDPRYAGEVVAYREVAERSMSVGDVLLIRRWWRKTAWACAPVGFNRLTRPPRFTDSR
jgi:hypothetical protein